MPRRRPRRPRTLRWPALTSLWLERIAAVAPNGIAIAPIAHSATTARAATTPSCCRRRPSADRSPATASGSSPRRLINGSRRRPACRPSPPISRARTTWARSVGRSIHAGGPSSRARRRRRRSAASTPARSSIPRRRRRRGSGPSSGRPNPQASFPTASSGSCSWGSTSAKSRTVRRAATSRRRE